MEIADRVAVMDRGRLEQAGPPRELYERPRSTFVMGFLGPVTRIGGRLVRPHDLVLGSNPGEGGSEAQVLRVAHLGFLVRVDLELADAAEPVAVQLTRAEADQLEPAAGDILYVRAPPVTQAVGA